MKANEITPELFAMVEQLGKINAYFYDYRKAELNSNDNIKSELASIESHLSEAVNSISQLMYIELMDKFYYK